MKYFGLCSGILSRVYACLGALTNKAALSYPVCCSLLVHQLISSLSAVKAAFFKSSGRVLAELSDHARLVRSCCQLIKFSLLLPGCEGDLPSCADDQLQSHLLLRASGVPASPVPGN